MALLLNVRSLDSSFSSSYSTAPSYSPPSPTRSSVEPTATETAGSRTTRRVSRGDGDRLDEESGAFHNAAYQEEDEHRQTESAVPSVLVNLPSPEEDDTVGTKNGFPPSDSLARAIHIAKTRDKTSEVAEIFGSRGSYSTIASHLYQQQQPPSSQPPLPDKEKQQLSKAQEEEDRIAGKDPDDSTGESLLAICVQVFFPFLVAGIGTCGAGLILDKVENWDVFKKVTEIFVLVPTLLGLKGNLEMTLASRVSTQVNLNKLVTWREQWTICWGNMALLQCQATVLSFLAACIAMTMRSGKGLELDRVLLLGASALFTASTASFVLGAITLLVVLVSHRFRVNPDNVATPIAASLGDVTTLGILAAIASYFHDMNGEYLASSVCVGAFLALVPLWIFLSYRNAHVQKVLFFGWTPVIIAVAITSAGGYILEFSIRQFRGFSIFQPVINGVAGNLVAVQASRISTYFHKHSTPGSAPPDGSNLCVSPCRAFFGTVHARAAVILLAMVIPGHLLFGYGITLVKGGDTVLTLSFLPIYLTSAVIQVGTLLYLAQCLIHFLWRFKIDPDNWAIPLLTALGDLSGMAVLTAAFFIHKSVVT